MAEYADGLPNLSGDEALIAATIEDAAARPVFATPTSGDPFAGIQSAFAIALHMHQPLIPAGGDDLRTAALISNLQYIARSTAPMRCAGRNLNSKKRGRKRKGETRRAIVTARCSHERAGKTVSKGTVGQSIRKAQTSRGDRGAQDHRRREGCVAARVSAATAILDRGWGKPREFVEATMRTTLEELVMESYRPRGEAVDSDIDKLH